MNRNYNSHSPLLHKKGLSLILLFPFILFFGCSGQGYQDFSNAGSQLLSSTGVVSSNQASALFKFGSSVADSVEEISEEEEYYLGRGVSATILSRYKPYDDVALNRYLGKVLMLVAAHSDRPETFGGYRIQILDSEEINAFAAPGGFVFVTTGFLKIVPDEDALAALLAHEVAHVVNAHGVNAIKEANLSESLLELGKAATPSEIAQATEQVTNVFGGSVEGVVTSLLDKGYSRHQEYESDTYAVTLLERTGYNSNGLYHMLHALQQAGISGGGWTSTHPQPEDRIDQLSSTDLNSIAAQDKRKKRFDDALRRLK